MYSLEQITSKILNTPPYQLPPIVHHGGLYQVDISYRGQKWHKVSPQLEHCMQGYFDFVVRVNDRKRYTAQDYQEMTAPVPLGSTVPVAYTNERPITITDEREVSNG